MKLDFEVPIHPPLLYKCIVVLATVLAVSAVLCVTGCKNLVGDNPPMEVGDVVMKDGTFKKASEVTNPSDAVAVVYKVGGGKAYAVGKKHEIKKWCIETADGNKWIIRLLVTEVAGNAGNLTFSGWYQDGSTGWTELAGDSNVNDTGTQANYPAWYYCKNYGNDTSNVPSDAKADLKTGWYFPSVAELYDIWKNKATVDASLSAISGDTFGSNKYFSSSNSWAYSDKACGLLFDNGDWEVPEKKWENRYVCAVRAFTY